jgi:hypothetical protein
MNAKQRSELAMKQKLNECMASLSKWCMNRSMGNFNAETTMTMLAHKVVEMTERIEKAGLAEYRK